MSKTSPLYLIPVCLLSACGGGGGGDDKEKINVTDASSAFQASPLVNTEHEFGSDTLDFVKDLTPIKNNPSAISLISLSGAELSLKFAPGGVKQVVRLSGGSAEMANTWASVEFSASDFVWNENPADIDYKIVRANATNTFDMYNNVSQTQRYQGTAVSEMKLGGQAVGLAYSDFGYLNIDVRGNYSFYNSSSASASDVVNFSYFEEFTQGNSSYAVADDAVKNKLAAHGGGNSRLVFTGKAFAIMSGTFVLPSFQENVLLKASDGTTLMGEDGVTPSDEKVNVVRTTNKASAPAGGKPFIGNVTLSVGTDSADMMLDFSNVGLPELNFASTDGSTWNLWYPDTTLKPSELTEQQKYVNGSVSGSVSDRKNADGTNPDGISITGKAELDYSLFGKNGEPQEGVGSFGYTQTTTITPAEGEARENTSLISGVFGVANPTVQTPTSSAP